jgi:hypothetical protein
MGSAWQETYINEHADRRGRVRRWLAPERWYGGERPPAFVVRKRSFCTRSSRPTSTPELPGLGVCPKVVTEIKTAESWGVWFLGTSQ